MSILLWPQFTQNYRSLCYTVLSDRRSTIYGQLEKDPVSMTLIQAKVTVLNCLPMSKKFTLVFLLMHGKHFCDYTTTTDYNCQIHIRWSFQIYSNSSYIAYGGGSSGFNSVVILYLRINDWGMLQLHNKVLQGFLLLLKSINFSAIISLVVNHRYYCGEKLVAIMFYYSRNLL